MSEKKQEKKTENKKAESKKIHPGVYIGGAVLVLLIAFGGILGAMYYAGWSNGFTTSVSDVFSLPIARVNGEFITLSKFDKARSSLENYQNLQASIDEGPNPVEQISIEELERNLLTRMIDDVIVAQLLEENGASISDTEVENELQRLSEVLGDDISVEDHVRQVYNFSLDEFRAYALRPGLQEFKLQQIFFNDLSVGEEFRAEELEKKQKAEELAKELRDGASFEEKAREVSEDGFTAEEGGDLGLISKGEMVPDFERVAFELEVGEVSDPVKTQFGYHVITVEEIQGEGDEEKRKTRHILFLVDDQFTNWFFEEKKKANVTMFGNAYSWNAEEGIIE